MNRLLAWVEGLLNKQQARLDKQRRRLAELKEKI